MGSEHMALRLFVFDKFFFSWLYPTYRMSFSLPRFPVVWPFAELRVCYGGADEAPNKRQEVPQRCNPPECQTPSTAEACAA